jgi:hypothetical protein
MFERYTEKARRAISFAHFEASHYGSPYIETEHLLLGLLREDRALARFVFGSPESIDPIRKEVESHIAIGERISTSVEIPLTNECKRILTLAAEEADLLRRRHIGTEHLLLGMLREDKCFAARILHARGAELHKIRKGLAQVTSGTERTRHMATIERVEIGEAIAGLLDAWHMRDAKRFSGFFEDDGQFWDLRRELWLGRSDIEKGVGLYFSSYEVVPGEGQIEVVKLGHKDLATVTLGWGTETGKPVARMTVVLVEYATGWSVVSASLIESGSV